VRTFEPFGNWRRRSRRFGKRPLRNEGSAHELF
jgi:hypothetical protein